MGPLHERQRQGYLELPQGTAHAKCGRRLDRQRRLAGRDLRPALRTLHNVKSRRDRIPRALPANWAVAKSDKCHRTDRRHHEGTAEFFGDKMDGAMDVIKNDQALSGTRSRKT